MIRPGAAPSTPTSSNSVGDGPYVAWNIIGGTLVAAGGVALVGGIVSLVEGGASASDTGATGRGIALVDVAPHILATGIVTLAINGSKHSRANEPPAVAAVPVVLPLASGGFAGIGGSF